MLNTPNIKSITKKSEIKLKILFFIHSIIPYINTLNELLDFFNTIQYNSNASIFVIVLITYIYHSFILLLLIEFVANSFYLTNFKNIWKPIKRFIHAGYHKSIVLF